MLLRILAGLLVIGVAAVFGGNPIPLRAGDLAPNVQRTKILRSGGSGGNVPVSFAGQVTVLLTPALRDVQMLVVRTLQ